MKSFAPFTLALSIAACVGCGSSTPEPKPETGEAPQEAHRRGGSGISMEAEVGALNEDDVNAIFKRSEAKMNRCFQKGTERVAYLGGKVRFAVRVDSAGKAKVFLSESTLGDRDTEKCMIDVLRSATWPTPQGGKEGRAESGFALDPDGDVREPVAWSESDLGKALGAAKDALDKCKSSSGAESLKATLYVETDGHASSVGVSGSGPETEQAADCVVSAMKGITFSSPGSYAAKVSISR
jgi:hypothetical protein